MVPLWRSWLGILTAATLLAAAALALDPRTRALFSDPVAPDELTLATARDHRGPLLWLDARHGDAYAREHIPEALPLDLDNWDTQIVDVIARWQPGMRVLVYCDDSACSSSRQVASRLRKEYQFDDVWLLHGGWSSWKKAVAQ